MKKGCSHNPACEHATALSKCHKDVKEGICKPSLDVRTELGLPFPEHISTKEFGVFLKKYNGRIPIHSF